MITVYFVVFPFAMIAGAAVDPVRYGDNYIFRGLIGFLCACAWPAIALFYLGTFFLGVVGLAGEMIKAWVVSKLE